MLWLETIINGVMLGSLYAVFGLGLALIFGVMRIANIAHGELVIAGAFLAYFLLSVFPVNPFLLVVPVTVIMFGFGWLLQTALVNRVLGTDPLPPLLVTFGISSVLQNLFVEVFGADTRSIDAGWIKTASLQIGTLEIGVLPLVFFAATVILFAGIHVILSSTRLGRIVRATADDPEIVQIMGVKRKQVYAMVMGAAAALAAIAGILLAMRSSFTPFSGVERLLIAFEVVVIGGLGSFAATFVAGILLGVVQLIGFQFDPESGLLYGHILLVLILLIRPQGFAGLRASR